MDRRIELAVAGDITAVAGPQRPADPSPDRAPGSVRRTSSIDTVRPHGLHDAAVMTGQARDIVTDDDGRARVVDTASAHLDVAAPGRELLAITTEPDDPAFQALLGAMVGPGFRGKLHATVPYADAAATPLLMLLDDMPGAALVSGYALLVAGETGHEVHDAFLDAQIDLCAGWANDAAMMHLIRATGRNAVNEATVVPPLQRAGDADAWHAIGPLGPTGMRRVRRTDVLPADADGNHRVDAWFRDTHFADDGVERAVHEYCIDAVVDGSTRTVLSIAADARVLPWMECPQALASAQRLVGRPLADLRQWVRNELVGTSTCTHLNDVLRNLADVDRLLYLLPLSRSRA